MNNFDPFTDVAGINAEIFDTPNDFETSQGSSRDMLMTRGDEGVSRAPITTKRITWKSSDKCFNCYDTETKETTKVAEGTEFIVLTSTMSILGARQCGKPGTPSNHWTNIYSNEFTNTKEDHLTVTEVDRYEDTRTTLLEGTYQEIKEEVKKSPNMYFNLFVYALVKGTDEVVRFSFNKSSREAGFEVTNFENMKQKSFKLAGSVEQTNGSVHYNVPSMEFKEISPADDQKAIEKAREIKDALDRRRGVK